MSAAVLSGLAPIAAAAANGGEPIATTAAAERIQQLQALLAQVEHGPQSGSPPTFASALATAQSGAAEPLTAAGDGAYTPAIDQAGDGAAYTPLIDQDGNGAAYTPAIDQDGGGGAYTPAIDQAGDGAAYAPLIDQAAARHGLDPSLLYGLIEQESGFDPSAASGAGALGLTQLMPSTAASLGVTEPLDPAQSIEGGARYLSQLLRQFAGNAADALAAYNAGPGAVEQYGGVPPYPETQQYVAKVLGYAAFYSQGGDGTGTEAAAPSATAAAAAPTATAAIAAAPTATATSEAIA
jgi:soluble lytic murein transglycosylase-like protein